jgi:hypothetical protein
MIATEISTGFPDGSIEDTQLIEQFAENIQQLIEGWIALITEQLTEDVQRFAKNNHPLRTFRGMSTGGSKTAVLPTLCHQRGTSAAITPKHMWHN